MYWSNKIDVYLDAVSNIHWKYPTNGKFKVSIRGFYHNEIVQSICLAVMSHVKSVVSRRRLVKTSHTDYQTQWQKTLSEEFKTKPCNYPLRCLLPVHLLTLPVMGVLLFYLPDLPSKIKLFSIHLLIINTTSQGGRIIFFAGM